MTSESAYMDMALELARQGLGEVWPNPAVGCVIVGAGESATIVGEGRTARGGRPHAEAVALERAGARAKGGTAYVTLEPCAHHGQTPPCTDALIAAGISSVVSALEDPDPRVGGRGHARLADAGVEVEVGLGAAAAREINRGFFTRIARGRPLVQLKLAVSANWKIAAAPGVRTQITGPEAAAAVQRLRAEADAVMVGQGTWAADDPRLTVRDPRFAGRDPVRIVLDARAELPLESNLVKTAPRVPVWLVCGQSAPSARRAALADAGLRILEIALADGRIVPDDLLRRLGNEGLTRLLVEGGGHLAASLLRADLVDELILMISPNALPDAGVPAFGDMAPEAVLERFTLASETALGADACRTYRL